MMFDRIKSLFHKERHAEVPPMPPWEEIVERMYDKCLSGYSDEVVRVVYAKDKTMRYVVLKKENGIFTYHAERIVKFDMDEWRYVCREGNALPAVWEPLHCASGKSVFSDFEELFREMKEEPEYKKYF